MSKIAVLIKTTTNRVSLKWAVNAIFLALARHDFRLYIADEAPLDAWKTAFYRELEAAGHLVTVAPGPVAVTVARNDLLDRLGDEEFVLRIDDDFELGGEFSIDKLLSVLSVPGVDFCADAERQIGPGRAPSGSVRLRAGSVAFGVPGVPPRVTLLPDYAWDFEEVDGVRYARADYMRNLILLKRDCLSQVRWNEEIQFVGEHLDFFLSLKAAGFQGAFTPDSIHLHRDDLKGLSVDLEQERAWRGDPEGTARRRWRAAAEKKWGGLPTTGTRPMPLRKWQHHAARLLSRAGNGPG